jgi:hypothetical protein
MEQCLQARSTIDRLVVAQRLQHQRATLRERSAEWAKVCADWTSAVERAGWLDLRPQDVQGCATALVTARDDARDAAKRLIEMEDVAKLAADPLWTRLLQAFAKATEALRTATGNAWRMKCDGMDRPTAPSVLRAQAANIPANRDVLKRYDQTYNVYLRLIEQSIPRSAADVSTLETAEDDCKQIRSELTTDAPAAVEAFFRAVDEHSATLASLTPEILEWLGEYGQLKQYSIRNSRA